MTANAHQRRRCHSGIRTPSPLRLPSVQCGAIGFTPLDFILPLMLYSKVRWVGALAPHAPAWLSMRHAPKSACRRHPILAIPVSLHEPFKT